MTACSPCRCPSTTTKRKAILKDLKGSDGVYAEPVWKERMYVGVILGNILIHRDVSPARNEPVPLCAVLFGLKRKTVRRSRSRVGWSRSSESINKRESKALALLTNRQIVRKIPSTMPKLLQTEHAKPDGFLEVKEGAVSGNRILFRDNLDMGQASWRCSRKIRTPFAGCRARVTSRWGCRRRSERAGDREKAGHGQPDCAPDAEQPASVAV